MPKMERNSSQAEIRRGAGPQLNIDLRYFWYPGFLALIFFAPLARGLFFPEDLLPFQTVGAVVLALAAFDALLRKKAKEVFHMTALYVGFLLLALFYGLSSIWAVAKAEAVQGFLRYAMYSGIFWMSTFMARTKKARNALLMTVFLSGCAVACIGLLSALRVFSFPGASDGARIMSTLQYPNALAAYMMFSSILGFTLWLSEERPLARLLYAAGVFCQSLTFLGSFSRGGWVIYPFALLALFLGLPRRRRNAFFLMGIGILSAILLTLRQFVTSIESQAIGAARTFFLAGLLVSLLIEVAFFVYGKIRESILISDAARKVMAWAFGLYAALIFMIYGGMLLGQYGVGGGLKGILPASFIKRLSTISLEDPSLLTRAFATRDAVRIFLDNHILGAGKGGWNALYHEYQSVLYWTTEVHNQAAQVLVEAGLFGFLSYVFIWVTIAFYTVKSFCGLNGSSAKKVALVGLTVASMAIGAHSLMDFELSLPGVFYQLIAVMGVLEVLFQRGDEFSSEEVTGARVRPAEAQDFKAGRKGRLSVVVGASLVLLTAAVTGVFSYRFQRAGYYGSLGAQALYGHDFRRAEALYLIARKYDPYTASYSIDLAQAYGALSILEKRDDLKQKALSFLDLSQEVDRNNITHRLKEIEIRQSLRDVAGAWEVARKLPELVPLDLQSYEIMAKTSVIAFMHFQKNDYLTPVLEIPDKLGSLQNSMPERYRKKWNPDKLNMSDALYLYVGQARLLSKNSAQAMEFLKRAKESPLYSKEAEYWIQACLIYEGKVIGGVEEAPQEVKLILSHIPK